MKTETKQKLDQLIGNRYHYNGKEFTITKVKELTSGHVVVITTARSYNLLPNEVEGFINELTPSNDKGSVMAISQTDQLSPEVYNRNATHQKLESSLITMIDKVMVDKEAIPQAKAICDIANAMVNMEKQQINFLKATGRL